MVYKSTWVLVAILVIEAVFFTSVYTYLRSISSTIPVDTVKSYFEKVIDVDGVLLGFAGITFTVSTQRWKRIDTMSVAMVIAVGSWYLISMVIAFLGLVVSDSIAKDTLVFLMYSGIWALMLGSTFLFWSLGVMALEPTRAPSAR